MAGHVNDPSVAGAGCQGAAVSPASKDAGMQVPAPGELIKRIRALPAAAPLLVAVGDEPGVYLVGGAVRDLLLGAGSAAGVGDLDLVAEGDVAALAARLGGRYRVHERFGTASVILDHHGYDFAMARRETYPEPGALPAVSPAGLREDLLRRDFTVNAIAVTLGGPQAGELTAAPGALDDLSARRLRVLHDHSFIDDPTRLLRLARYASRLGFAVEPETLALARAAVAGGALATVSGARIGAELRLLARENDPVAAIAGLGELGIDRAIDPRFGITDVERARRALALLPGDGRRDVLALALAAADVPPADLEPLLDELAFPAGDRDAVLAAVSGAEPVAEALAGARRPSQLAAAVGRGSVELVALAGALGPEEPAREWLERLRLVRLEIDGDDLIAAGVPEGPGVGQGLRAALAAKLDGRIAGRESELGEALQAANA
jgi:tRNA nucleotidyltransferase (CCA-adding enzyme)